MKYDFLLEWGIFGKFPVQAKLSFSLYACCVHARGGRESFLFFPEGFAWFCQEALTVEEKLSADLFCAVMPISAHALPASKEICS